MILITSYHDDPLGFRYFDRCSNPLVYIRYWSWGDRDFREARKYAGRRDMFFCEMHAALRYVLHETWRDFLAFITADEDLE